MPQPASTTRQDGKRGKQSGTVALFVTCLADLLRPSVAFASLELLQRAGFEVEVPESQTCCGQPAYNSGDYAATAPLARQVIASLEAYPAVVVPSGSCAGMLREHYPRLLEGAWQRRAENLAERVWELTAFLDCHGAPPPLDPPPRLPPLTYHDACAGLRELGIRDQPRRLLSAVCGAAVREMAQTTVCCGFGGTFCAKMPAIATQMADSKLAHATDTGASLVLAGDLGCLLNLAGRASREGLPLQFRHVAEVLAGHLEEPPIGEQEH